MTKLNEEFFELTSPEEKVDDSAKVVSYSQYSTWLNCPQQWKLLYVDNKRTDDSSIDTVFGTAMHETIQEWLPTHFTDPKKAKKWDWSVPFKDKFMTLFQEKIVVNEDGTKTFLCTPETFQEYYDDGCAILDHLQKYGSEFFPTKDYRLVGCEVKLTVKLDNGTVFRGYLDIVIHDTRKNEYHIVDLKTSRMGWYEAQKTDPRKLHQLLLYKKYFSERFKVPLENIYPKFIILKRKIKEHPDFIIRRLSNFEPSHGKISMNKVMESWGQFLNECFDGGGNYRTELIKATPSEKACKYCPFSENAELCPESYLNQRRLKKEANKKMLKV